MKKFILILLLSIGISLFAVSNSLPTVCFVVDAEAVKYTEPVIEDTTPVESEEVDTTDDIETEATEITETINPTESTAGESSQNMTAAPESTVNVQVTEPEEAVVETVPEEPVPQQPIIEEPYVETVADEMARRGSIGRLTIPSVGVDVALFKTSIYNIDHSQPIVDGVDSAAYMPDTIEHYGFIIIGDHVHQGFSAIKNSVPGQTYAYIDRGDYKEAYVCVDIFIGYNGYNGRGGMFDANGNDVAGMNDGGICMYTCNPDGTITITFWKSA